jgi:hypothetical protein
MNTDSANEDGPIYVMTVCLQRFAINAVHLVAPLALTVRRAAVYKNGSMSCARRLEQCASLLCCFINVDVNDVSLL